MLFMLEDIKNINVQSHIYLWRTQKMPPKNLRACVANNQAQKTIRNDNSADLIPISSWGQ